MKPFHHGNLRAVLLDLAEITVHDQGIEALSLREIARQAGVSHGAPRAHFPDRQALLDALAERGFTRLAASVTAITTDPALSFEDRFRAVASAYVSFAITESSLLDLMFASKNADPPESLTEAAGRMFSAFATLIDQGIATGDLSPTNPEDLKLLFTATMQGIATLVTSGRIPTTRTESLVNAAATMLLTPARRSATPLGDRPPR